MNLIELPDCMLMEIFECLTYEEVSKNRLVCRRVNQICQQVLNAGFSRAVRQHATIFKRIKSMLPRRESERRNHSLARHADILTSIETRISMLSMTYSKYIDLNLCCFIPGRVLDEIFRILLLVSKSRKTLRPHEVLQELRDISSMAIEHFDEKIANLLKTFIDAGCSRSHVGSIDNKRITPSSSGLGSISFSVQQSGTNMWSQAGNASKIWTPPTRGSALKLTCNNCNEFACDGVLNRVSALITMKSPHSESSDSAEGDSVQPSAGCHNTNPNSENRHNNFGCPEAKATMVKYRKLEMEYKNGVQRMNRMQQIQAQQSRRLQQTMSTISTMSTQITELKKRLEDLDAKNREISANIKQINPAGSESTTTSATASVVTSQDSDNVEHDCDTDADEGPSSAKRRRCDTDSAVRKRKSETDDCLE